MPPAWPGARRPLQRLEAGETRLPHTPAQGKVWNVPPHGGVQGRTERMSADGLYGVGMRCLVLTPSPSPAKLERGDQSHARGRSNAV